MLLPTAEAVEATTKIRATREPGQGGVPGPPRQSLQKGGADKGGQRAPDEAAERARVLRPSPGALRRGGRKGGVLLRGNADTEGRRGAPRLSRRTCAGPSPPVTALRFPFPRLRHPREMEDLTASPRFPRLHRSVAKTGRAEGPRCADLTHVRVGSRRPRSGSSAPAAPGSATVRGAGSYDPLPQPIPSTAVVTGQSVNAPKAARVPHTHVMSCRATDRESRTHPWVRHLTMPCLTAQGSVGQSVHRAWGTRCPINEPSRRARIDGIRILIRIDNIIGFGPSS